MINWKVRFKNKIWIASFIALVVAFVYNILELFEITPQVGQEAVMSAITAILQILGMIGIIADPTTAGLKDSLRAMTYEEPYKDK